MFEGIDRSTKIINELLKELAEVDLLEAARKERTAEIKKVSETEVFKTTHVQMEPDYARFLVWLVNIHQGDWHAAVKSWLKDQDEDEDVIVYWASVFGWSYEQQFH